MKHTIFQALAKAARNRQSVALGIITSVKGSSPQKTGAKALFYPDGNIVGTLGGGCLEAEIRQRALAALRTGQPAMVDMVLDNEFGWDDGLICGGHVQGIIIPNAQNAGATLWEQLATRNTPKTWGVKNDFSIALANSIVKQLNGIPPTSWLYLETITPPCALWIAGSGHIARAVAPLALQLDFAVTIFDDRPDMANHNHFPTEVTINTGDWSALCAMPFPDAPVFGLIVTRGHKHDSLVLESWIHRPFAFLGMIGSARKARTIFDHFVNKGIATPAQLTQVACPVGINIHAQTVPEIAVSIMAQFIAKRAELTKHPHAKLPLNSKPGSPADAAAS